MSENITATIAELKRSIETCLEAHRPDAPLEPWVFHADGRPICCIYDLGDSLEQVQRDCMRRGKGEYIGWRPAV